MKENLWDQKEKNYPRFDPNDCEFQKKILDIAKSWGVKFDDKNIIEIGCGTGNYTFLLAQMAKSVLALDFSENMLKVLENDAKKLNLSEKITIQKADFSEFNTDKIYDIAFGAMTPALSPMANFEKFHNLAKHKIWLGWAGERDSRLLNAIFEAHGEILHVHDTANNLKKWLKNNAISYQNMPLIDIWENEMSVEDAISDQSLHVKMHDIEPNFNLIREVVMKFADKNGKVYNQTKAKVELIAW